MNNLTGERETQVVIIGAGPTGLSMAIQLQRYAIDFVILDTKPGPSEFSKAIAVQARSLEIFEEIGLAEEALHSGRIVTALNVYERGIKKAGLNLSDMGKGISEYSFALALAQDKTEELFVQFLAENEKHVLWNATFCYFEKTDDSTEIYYRNERDEEKRIKARYIVGADGASSRVREQLSIPFEGDTVPKLFYVADVRLKSTVICENQLYMFLIEKGFILFFPMVGAGNYRVIGIIGEEKGQDAQITFEELIPGIKENVGVTLNVENIRWFSTYKVHTLKARSFNIGIAFLAGDAAHIHTPAGGQGMNTGIQDSYNLAWKMALTLQGKVKNCVLESYRMEREQNAVDLLKTTDRIFDMMAGTNPFWNFMRLKVFPVMASYLSRHHWINRFYFR